MSIETDRTYEAFDTAEMRVVEAKDKLENTHNPITRYFAQMRLKFAEVDLSVAMDEAETAEHLQYLGAVSEISE